MKYIDADKLIAEIERLYAENKIGYKLTGSSYCEGAIDILDDIEQFITSLQQEQPEVDLEKEIDNEWKKCNPTDEGMGVETANIHIEAFDIIARHFYEFGLKAKEENK